MDIKPLKVLEFFCGIGGMHYGFSYANINIQSTPIDINQHARLAYKYNFPECNPLSINIDHLKLEHDLFSKNSFDVWTLSPPCQPYTRQSNKAKDTEDNRSISLLNIFSILSQLSESKLPSLIVLENVKNFETSQSFEFIKKILLWKCYNYHIFLISPLELGFPNQRLRFYLVAIKEPLKFPPILDYIKKDEIINSAKFLEIMTQDKKFIHPSSEKQNFHIFIPSVDSFLDHDSTEFDIPDKFVCKKAFKCVDIVNSSISLILKNVNGWKFYKDIASKQLTEISAEKFKPYTLCFTRSYGRYLNATGSVKLKSLDTKGLLMENSLCLNHTKPNYLAYPNRTRARDTTGESQHLHHIVLSPLLNSSIQDFRKGHNRITESSMKSMVIAECPKSRASRYIIESFHNEIFNTIGERSSSIEPKWSKSQRKCTELPPDFSEYEHLNPENLSNEEISNQGEDFTCDEMEKFVGKLRFFSPIEISRLMGFKGTNNYKNSQCGNALWDIDHKEHQCFPQFNTDADMNSLSLDNAARLSSHKFPITDCLCGKNPFGFPSQLSKEIQWRLIGNSLNPQVITCLLIVCGIDKLI